MITYQVTLDMMPGEDTTEVQIKQYTNDFQIVFGLYTHSGVFTMEEGTTAFIRGTKSDGNGYSADAASVDTELNTVTISGDSQITPVNGSGKYELVLINPEGGEVSSSNFIIRTVRTAMDPDTLSSETKLRELVEIEDHFDEIIAAGALVNTYRDELRQASATIQSATAAGQASVLETVSEAQATAISSIASTRTQVLAEMRSMFDVTAIQTAASTAQTKAIEARKRASSAANYAWEAEASASNAAASARRAAVGETYAEAAQSSAEQAAASAQLAADRAQEILALEIGRRAALSETEIRTILDELVTQKLLSLNIPTDLLYSADYLLQLSKNGVAIGDGVTITGGASGGGSGNGTWGSAFGLS